LYRVSPVHDLGQALEDSIVDPPCDGKRSFGFLLRGALWIA
jgi:hypothetical protein